MGANQSSKSRQQFAPKLQTTSSTVGLPSSSTPANNKNSFSKQQLNRLLRKSLPTHTKLNDQHQTTNKCKLNGNNKSDELTRARVSSGQQLQSHQLQPRDFLGHKSIYGLESRENSQNCVSDNSNASGGGGSANRFNNNSNKKYFVTDKPIIAQQQEELACNNQTGSNGNQDNGLLPRATTLSYDANRDPLNRHLALYDSHQVSCRPFEQDQRSLLVRQQHQNILEHQNKSIVTNSTPPPPRQSQQQARQPLNSSNAHHHNHHQYRGQPQHQNQHHRQASNLQPQLPQHQQHLNNSDIRPTSKSSKPQQQQLQQLKSSCSPSSASAVSSSSSSSSQNSSPATSSESLKLQQINGSVVPLTTNQDQRPLKAAGIELAKLNSSASRTDYSINQKEQLVAMQHHQHHNRHRRAHSSSEPLSWSKQQAASINLRNNNDNRHLLLANNHQQTSRGQQKPQQQQYHEQGATNSTLDSHLVLSPDLYRQYQQQHQMGFDPNHADQIEQFYSRNLHLLAGNQQDAYQHHLNQPYNQPNQAQLQFYNITTLAHMSAPLQRRYKWPKQHYEYLNTSAAAEGHHNPSNQQHLFHVQVPQSQLDQLSSQQLSNARYDNEYANGYLQMVDQPVSSPLDNHLASYFDQDLANKSRVHQGGHVSSTLKSRSKSLSKSPALRGKSRSRNPLAGIFSTPTGIGANEKNNQKFGANTIHRLSSSKSHQSLHASISRSASQSNGNANSLKRVKSSPLTAQQTSYEAMRTIDMYLIRQIARSCMDFEMEQKIDLEIRLRELAAQSILEAKTEIDVLEVEKSLLTSDQRMNCYASQLEQQRKRLSNPSLSTSDSGRGSKASRWDSLPPGATTGQPPRSDVIGANNVRSSKHETGSPSFSESLSKSSQSSPSKLSPVSGESATTASQQSPPPTSATGGITSIDQERKTDQSWSSLSRSNHHVIRRPTSTSNTLSRRHKSQRQRQRERLVQLITRQYNIDYNLTADSRVTLTLGELRIPLMWRDVDHFKGRGDYRRYAVFCLVKIGSQIYDTQLISDVDRQMTDLTFDDMIMFNNVELDFDLELEVYSCVYLEQFSLSSTPRKLMEKLSNSVGRAMGRRLASQTASVNYIKELEAYDKSYRFAMIANAKLTLVDASDSIKTFDLHLMSPEAHGRHSTASSHHNHHHQGTGVVVNQSNSGTVQSGVQANRHYQPPGSNHNGIVTAGNQRDLQKNTLPLFGHFCCRLHVQPEIFNDKHATSGYL